MRVFLILACVLSLASSESRASVASCPITFCGASSAKMYAQVPTILAGITTWLEELLSGARKVPMPSQNVRNQSMNAYRYTQSEDRRGNEHGLVYYLFMGIWRLAAAGTAAIITAKAFSKQKPKSKDRVVIAALLVPFLAGLFYPLAALFGAFVIWLACAEKTSKAT